jgi:photosystem II stability/assembly factor-like uncharacterized protein
MAKRAEAPGAVSRQRLAGSGAARETETARAQAPASNFAGRPATVPEMASATKLSEPPVSVSIRTADGVERWRLGGSGMIQHLEPYGEWISQPSGVTANLTAGSAPSPSVCWAVGENGTVLRTIDGAHWQSVSSPTSADLAAVAARNADSAVLTTAGGERFTTSDGGRTWRAL